MTAMCKAMRELAGGNFDVVLPGLGRKDELGEMAGAVEEFKVQAIAKAERDAAAHDAQNKASSAARRTELIRFADDFETAVGAIVSNVSASAVQLEAGGRNADADRGNHPEPVQPGCRRIGRSLQQHAIGRHRDRGAFRPRSMKSEDGCANPTRSRKRRWFRRSRPTAASANCRAPRRRSATWSS